MQYHGGNVYAAARELRKPVDTLLDFSASINPLGPSPKAIRAIVHGLLPLRHYPDPDCWILRQALAKRWHLEPERFAIGNGSSELIHLLPSALAIHHALIIGPTFSEYANAVTVSGGRITTLTASRSNGYKPPIDRVIQIVRASYSSENGRRPIDAIFLCNPNSPTGQACEVLDVVRLVTSARRYRVWVIVDETFIEYCESHSILPQLREFPRVVVLRSFTKFYALPGLRVGYLAASEEAVRRVKAHQAPWSVNFLAQTAAVAALNDRDYARQSLAYMNQERIHFAARLESLPGSSVFPSHANFLLAELPSSLGASQVTATLRQQGLLIRDCSLIPGLNDRSVRIAVRTSRQNDRLMAAIRLLGKRTRHVPH